MPRTGVPAPDARPGAVLLLFGEGQDGPDLLFIERAATLRAHAGQPAFPGGARDPHDIDDIAVALREAREEVGLDPAGVEVFGTLPPLAVWPNNFVITPVLAWWRDPHAVRPVDTNEVAAVERVSISTLADPDNRCVVAESGRLRGPGFQVHGLLVWGFTGLLTDSVLEWGGWALPWDRDRVVTRSTGR